MDLPSKKIITALVFALIILIISFWSAGKDGDNFSYQKLQNKDNSILIGDVSIQDSDNDGLKDWEEILWKTDSQNPDTDGDGILDGQEIKLNRDPLVAGPNDKKRDIIQLGNKNKNSSPKEQTLTDLAAQKLFLEYLDSSKNGIITTKDKNRLVNSFTSLANGEIVDSYKTSDIKISTANSSDDLKKYGNEMGLIIKKNYKQIKNIPLLTFYEALLNEDKKKLKELDSIIRVYNKIAQEGLSLSIPIQVAETHLSLLNGFKGVSLAMVSMQKVFEDPLLGISGINQYQKRSEIMFNDFNKINKLFADNRVSFTENESGAIFGQTIKIMQ